LFWKANVTPQDIIRLSSTRGPDLVRSMVERRFKNIFDKSSPNQSSEVNEEKKHFTDYIYHISSAPARGEYALNALLEPLSYDDTKSGRVRTHIYARAPLHPVLPLLKDTPVLIMYGDHDWMKYDGVEDDVQNWKNKGMSNVFLQTVPHGGHQFFLENPRGFEKQLLDWVEEVHKHNK
jgi:pimeloyl-ACP methyl ester carboxylesterase